MTDLQRGLLRTLKRLKRKPCVADRRNKIAGLRERLFADDTEGKS